MNLLRIIGLGIALIIALFMIVAYFLPGQFEVKRSILIKTSPENAYNHINSLKKWTRWSIWNKEVDSTFVPEFSEVDSDKGAFMKWKSQSIGKGKIEITETAAPQFVKIHLDIENGKFVSDGILKVTKQGEEVKVEWTETGDLGWNPISRYYGVFMLDKMLGDDYEKSLVKLKKIIEM